MSDSVIFGVPIDGCTMAETIDRLGELIRLGREQDRTHQVATVNVDFLVNALSSPEIMALLQSTDLNLADGMPLLWASRLFGTPLRERVAGADLVPLLAGSSEQHGWRIHLFGAAPGVADRARSIMLSKHPGARITADAGPSHVDVDTIDESIIASIRAVDPDVLCVALGNPKQEQFIASYRAALRCPVMIGVGGSLDMLVGDKRRAPRWAQRVGAEWIFRAAQEPSRLGRRYAHDLRLFGPRTVSYWIKTRRHRREPRLHCEIDALRLTIRLGDGPRVQEPIELGPKNPDVTAVEIDLRGVDALRAQDHALLTGVLREARLRQLPVAVTGVSTALRACLEDYRSWPLFDRSVVASQHQRLAGR